LAFFSSCFFSQILERIESSRYLAPSISRTYQQDIKEEEEEEEEEEYRSGTEISGSPLTTEGHQISPALTLEGFLHRVISTNPSSEQRLPMRRK